MKTDITIIGSGLVGITAACALAQNGFSINVIDSEDISQIRTKGTDGRTCAIASGSAAFFKKIGAWEYMAPHAGQILDIRVTDGQSPLFLHYDHQLLGQGPMGYIIENYHIREALFTRAKQLQNINIIAPAQYKEIKFSKNRYKILLEDQEISSTLLIAADGKNSKIRTTFGIETNNWDYNQWGLVCTINHTKHHQFIAQERFLPQGPFAVLPMAGGYSCSLVWTEKANLAKLYLNMEKEEIEQEIQKRTGNYLGDITLSGRMYSYPLSLCKAKNYIKDNLILIGDAAHAMHPLAGQGFNVGIRDVEQLMLLLQNNECLNNNNLPHILSTYEKSRMFDSIALLGITDILNRLFSNNIFPLRIARRLGMAGVNKTTGLKKLFMQHAMGKM